MDSQDKAITLMILGLFCVMVISAALGTVAAMKRAEVAGLALEYKAQAAPDMARICAAYFDWSLIAKDRVPSFEQHCAEAFDFQFKD